MSLENSINRTMPRTIVERWTLRETLAIIAATLGLIIGVAAPKGFVSVAGLVVGTVSLFVGLFWFGGWRVAVVIALVTGAVKGGFDGADQLSGSLNFIQFGSLLVAGVISVHRVRIRSAGSANGITRLLVALLVVATLSVLFSDHGPEIASQVAILGVVTFFLITTYDRRWSSTELLVADTSMLFWVIVAVQSASLVILSVWSIGLDPDYGRFTGVLSNANYAGIASALGILLGLGVLRWSNHRVATMFGIIALIPPLWMTHSRGSIVAVVIGLAAQLFLAPIGRFRVLARTTAVVAVMGAFIFTLREEGFLVRLLSVSRDHAGDVTAGRAQIYEEVWRLFQLSPILGGGYRSTELELGIAPHNSYLGVIADLGIIGGGVFFALIGCILATGRPLTTVNALTGAAAGVLAVELTESTVFGFGGPTAVVSWLVLLAFAAIGRNDLRLLPKERTEAP